MYSTRAMFDLSKNGQYPNGERHVRESMKAEARCPQMVL